jgi:hypothetical protein
VGWFRRTPVSDDEIVLTGDTVDDARMARLIELSERLRNVGVSYDDIQERAQRDRVPFNAALEALHRERVVGSERGAAAVEFAIVAPLLFMLVFAVIQFGIAFMQVQTIRGAVREGGRYAAVGATESEIQTKANNAATGTITNSGAIDVVGGNGGTTPCDMDKSAGKDVTVKAPPAAYGGGIIVSVPFLPVFTIDPTLEATFRCEV